MKKVYYFLIILFLQVGYSYANVKITFIDMNKIISSSKPGISILKQLKEINRNNLNDFNNKEKILKEREREILAQKTIISNDKFSSNVDILKIDIKNMNS